jgi:hypothetical protein
MLAPRSNLISSLASNGSMTLKDHSATTSSVKPSRTCAIIHSMKFRSKPAAETNTEDLPATAPLPFPRLNQEVGEEDEYEESALIKTVGWISAGLGAVAIGLFIGREIRQRYKFNRRTPYDFYAHSGDEQDVDFGLGI